MSHEFMNARKERLMREAMGAEPGAASEVLPIVSIIAFVLLFAVVVTSY